MVQFADSWLLATSMVLISIYHANCTGTTSNQLEDQTATTIIVVVHSYILNLIDSPLKCTDTPEINPNNSHVLLNYVLCKREINQTLCLLKYRILWNKTLDHLKTI